MKISNQALIEDLKERTQEIINKAKSFESLDEQALNWKATPEKWSILECFEHLNRYANFYIPEITQRIQKVPKTSDSLLFKSGWLGNYFAKSMLPKEQLNKMNTFKEMNPAGSQLDKNTLQQFLADQQKIMQLLEESKTVNLSKIKTSISISKYIKLRLGDTFRVVVYHNQRHLVQAKNVLNQQAAA